MKDVLKFALFAVAAVAVSMACVLVGRQDGVAWPVVAWPGRDLLNLRLARVAAGFVAGAALASSGAVFQAVLRNPLADPYVLGVSGGAALGAAAMIVAGFAGSTLFALPVGSFAAAVLSLALVIALASGRRAGSESGLILCGVIVGAMASSLLMLIQSFASASGLQSITWWMLGSLQSIPPALLSACAMCVVVGFLASWWMARDLDALTLGAQMAHHLGVDARKASLMSLGAATLSAAAAVAMTGLIGFVGLIAPHVVRRMLGAGHRRLLPACLFAGGAFLVLCDTLARVVRWPRELPVGVVTALLGGPFFIWVLRRKAR